MLGADENTLSQKGFYLAFIILSRVFAGLLTIEVRLGSFL